jgi:hypothetical protein
VLCAVGCSDGSKALTQIELTVDSDLKVPDEIDHVSIAVSGMVTDSPAVADLLDEELPRHLTLLHEGGPLGPVVVTATALHGKTTVVERVVQLKFAAGETKHVAIDLQRACVDVSCPSGSSCEDGECRDIAKGEPTTPADDGGADASADGGESDAGPTDAGESDASVDSGTTDASQDAGSDAAQDAGQDAGDSGPPVNQPPECTITEPAADTTLIAGQSARFAGRCTDPESGRRLTAGLRWSSDRDGALGSGGNVDVALVTAGAHVISLCAADPTDSALVGCGTLDLSVALPDPPTASIDSVTQGAKSDSPFATSPGISFMGTATGQMVTVAWRDTFIGQFGTTANATLMSPQVGRHLVTLTATDNVGQRAVASRELVVLANSASQLVDAYGLANTTFATAGSAQIEALAADSTDHALIATSVIGTPTVYRLDATDTGASPSLSLTAPTVPAGVHAIAIAEDDELAYLATGNGLTVCAYTTASGFGSCSTFKAGHFPSNEMQAVARAGANGDDYLVVGTSLGLLAGTTVTGSNNGNAALDNSDVLGLAAADDVVWVATHGGGLFEYDLANDEAHGPDGGPSDQLTAVAIDRLGMIWVGSDDGIGRYDDAHDSWLTLSTDQSPEPGLPSNAIRCLASTQVTIGTMVHDVIWVGTDMGVTRIDAISASLMNLTTADGLPSASVRSIVVLSDGTKLIGTDAGLARYTGP